jgi:hypothetical protein
MEVLGDVGHVESHFGPFGDSVSVGARLVLLGDEDQVVAHFHPVGDSANLDTRLVHGFVLNIPWARKSF